MKVSAEEFARFKADGGLQKFKIVSGSMLPLIRIGDEVVVDTGTECRLGDIIVFWQDGKLICHILWHRNRVFSNEGMSFITRSLQSQNWDLAITTDQILGKVVNFKLSWWWKVRLAWRDRSAPRKP